MSNTAISYFPDMDGQQPLITPDPVVPPQASPQKSVGKSTGSKAIAYFPDFKEDEETNEAAIADPWLTPATQTEMTVEAMQALRHNVDRELVLDPVYREAIADLKRLHEDTRTINELLKTVIHATIAATVQEIRVNPAIVQLESPKASWLPLIANALSPEPETVETPPVDAEKERRYKLTKIGQILQQAREKQGISLNQLSQTTHVVAHYIEALETGNIQDLPEDLYVRGFIRHLGNALKLDGEGLANVLMPEPQAKTTSKAIAPVSTPETPGSIQPHWAVAAGRYIGYGALVAGAVSFLSWSMQQQQLNTVPLQPSSGDFPAMDPNPSQESTSALPKSNPKLTPPETMETP